jgi:glyoxylase-like metal-dependent hydrolase (beta-lactamase superfamily II)
MARDDAAYEVLAVRYGTRMTTKSDVYLNFGVYGEPDSPIGMDYFFWVVRNQDRTVLVDCGFNARSGARRNRTMLCEPAEALQALGIAAGDVSQVLVTHAHYDHVGNLDLFPEAEVVIARRELEFWTSSLAEKPLFAHSAEVDDIGVIERLLEQDRVLQLDGESADPLPGISVQVVGGHTPGQAVVRVQTESGPVLLASDTLHYYEELELDRPFAHVVDLAGMYAGFDLLRQAQDAGDVLVAGHDPQVMDIFPEYAAAPGLAVRVG